MTKLEEKLLQLGYESKSYILNTTPKPIKVSINDGEFEKKYDKGIKIVIDTNRSKINKSYIVVYLKLESQSDLDNLQQAFNQLQKDLEVLKNVSI